MWNLEAGSQNRAVSQAESTNGIIEAINKDPSTYRPSRANAPDFADRNAMNHRTI